MKTTPQRTFDLNAEKIRKHFIKHCADMGMNPADWDSDIGMFELMMEGTSPKRLQAVFTNKNSGKQIVFTLGQYYGKYKITLMRD